MTDSVNFEGDKPDENVAKDETDFSGSNVGEEKPNTDTPSDSDDVILEHEGRKFTKADLLKKLEHSESFIDTLKKERDDDRKLIQQVNDKLSEQVELKEVIEEMKRQGQFGTKEEKGEAVEKGVDPDKIAESVFDRINSQKVQEQREVNWKDVTSNLNKQFGEKTNETVYHRAQENGLSVAEAAELARSKPKVFLRMFPELEAGKQKGGTFHSPGFSREALNRDEANKPTPSGYTKAKSDKERVQSYLKRLEELSS